ncbi:MULTISPECIES: SDR family NAD(P)-dependent oxidoreductase [unclassified Mucilaginibacter]|uniref:SDR family NAD(P)-dependent oxidoreductase n=1 Tax=unclassified Mucilaginibacter TaxID=2617802 RepID=UPI002AC99A56|nr:MULTISPECIES: SDR family NAD(P)-dependent oxidoreductase [unclassified Mucilaginibacter]MEB0260987.1 SDR family NAD(P)-dependent oxidoreductase [Mucilaginibacter sp. 10I4]MEB0279582.1 SDR family NAD(P)-dependent oxidoreductase [Mucilaginibacter sp. 10B2]MEB0302017.1 SDR family NAD(P)-dependent oxidoreductase [Mucilaginibacter sp. 5C4]WPX22550.1 SDR family NAD(P)-dependent oxidoreductase [Mucilaginibacter sp. 5C4]
MVCNRCLKRPGVKPRKTIIRKRLQRAATSRNIADLANAVDKAESFLPLAVNITDEKSVNDAISQTISLFGKIDVVVNNADYGLVGSLEELSDEPIPDFKKFFPQ